LEPTIIQWHSSFWTESIFFSLQLISLGLIIKKKKNIFHYLITGIFIGLLYLQKTTAMFYIFPVILYFIISIKNKRTISIVGFVFGYLIVIFFLGYHNFKRSNIFYVTPAQSKVAHYHYLVRKVISIKNNISESEVVRRMKKSELKWITVNNINLNSEKDRRKIYNYYQKYAFEVFVHNPFTTAKIYIKKTIHHSLLNPVQIYFWYKYNNNDNGEQYHTSSDHKKWIWKRILYSLIIYFFILIGIFYLFKKREYKNFNYFIILSIFYYMFMLGWMGNTRYFMPSLILLSIFFGEGMFLIFQRFLRKNVI
jgi:4-amino-4-deoxy-L-arabinose transferase-like glycosyltransferase